MITAPLLKNFVFSERDFQTISRLVYETCGIHLHMGKRELVRARLAKLLRQGRFDSFADYIHHVEQDTSGQELIQLIDAISTNLTSFFRENDHFVYLQNEYLSACLARKHEQRSYRLRVWSAGCSSGEEPYTIGIVLSEVLPSDRPWDVKILATDISTRVLGIAREGVYDEQKVKSVPKLLKQRYLHRQPGSTDRMYQVSDSLKDMILFRRLNLQEPWPVKGPIDVIFCRNVMIYFDKQTQQRLIERFWEVLAPGGVLFTGHSESLTGIAHSFKYVQPTIYSKP
jgi:chemotaxis protein methyltransferase CheR